MAGWISSKLKVAETFLQQIDQQAAESLGKNEKSPSHESIDDVLRRAETVPLKDQLKKKSSDTHYNSNVNLLPRANHDPGKQHSTRKKLEKPARKPTSRPSPILTEADWTELLGAPEPVSNGIPGSYGSEAKKTATPKRSPPVLKQARGLGFSLPNVVNGDSVSPPGVSKPQAVTQLGETSKFLLNDEDLVKKEVPLNFTSGASVSADSLLRKLDGDSSVSLGERNDGLDGNSPERGISNGHSIAKNELHSEINHKMVSSDENSDFKSRNGLDSVSKADEPSTTRNSSIEKSEEVSMVMNDQSDSIGVSYGDQTEQVLGDTSRDSLPRHGSGSSSYTPAAKLVRSHINYSESEERSESESDSDSTDSEEDSQRKAERRSKREKMMAEAAAAKALEAIKEREDFAARLEGEKQSLEKILAEWEKQQAQEVHRVAELRQEIESKEAAQQELKRRTSNINQNISSLNELEMSRGVEFEREILEAEYSFTYDKIGHLQGKAKALEESILMTREASEHPTEVESELKKRLSILADHLIQKQAQVEVLTSEKAMLLLRLEAASRSLSDHNRSMLSLENPASSSGMSWKDDDIEVGLGRAHNHTNMRIRQPIQEELRSIMPHIMSMLRQLDALFSAGAVFLRRNRTAQGYALVYLVCLHVWVTYILLSQSRDPDSYGSGAIISLESINKTSGF
ncbi:hypothetical protein AMTRI_Chr04g247690 [Amborella trichopoda]